MSIPDTDKAFTGSIPSVYEKSMVPTFFAPYARDLVIRLASRPLNRVLEIACGTGAVTRELAAALPESVAIVATDLNQAMLDVAAQIGTSRPVAWRQADAMQLPFEDGGFDAVLCQFGAMFFPDKAKAFSEVRRVLRPGGVFLFNVWDRIEESEFAHTVSEALAALFPDDPPRFMARTPHGYHDHAAITRDLHAAGWSMPRIETVTLRSVGSSALDVAVAFYQGTPMKGEIEARDKARLEEAVNRAEAALVRRFGSGQLDGKMQALVIEVGR